MNASLPVLTGKDVLRALARAGFVLDRVVGSHHVMTRSGDPRRTVSVPVHGNRDLKRGTLRAIVRQAGLIPEEFRRLLEA